MLHRISPLTGSGDEKNSDDTGHGSLAHHAAVVGRSQRSLRTDNWTAQRD